MRNNDIDEIFDMLSWNNNVDTQQAGIYAAGKIQNISVLFQPNESKEIWQNCAIVISQKGDEKLSRYIYDMFCWLQDMNWPGAEIIYDRLLKMPYDWIENTFLHCMRVAELSLDTSWFGALKQFEKDLQQQKNT